MLVLPEPRLNWKTNFLVTNKCSIEILLLDQMLNFDLKPGCYVRCPYFVNALLSAILKTFFLLRKNHFDVHQALSNDNTRLNLYWPKGIVMFETSLATTKTHKIKKGRKLSKQKIFKILFADKKKRRVFSCQTAATAELPILRITVCIAEVGGICCWSSPDQAKLKNNCSN